MEGNLPFLLCFTLYLRAISKYKVPGGLHLEVRFNGGFFALPVWGAYIWRGLFSEFWGISDERVQPNSSDTDNEGAIESVCIIRLSILRGSNLEKMYRFPSPSDKANCP